MTMPNDITLSRKAAAARVRSEPKRVTGRLKEACMLMAEGMSYQEAAAATGMTTRGMRMALEKAHVIAFLRHQRQVLRASMSGQNLAALARVRDQTSNPLATVRAVQAIEQMDADQAHGRGVPASPGLVVIIEGARTQSAKPVTIEHEPDRSRNEPDSA
jgi:hypothetical protein